MKRIGLLICFSFVFFITGCSWGSNKKIDITETSFSVDSCDKYFQLVDCILNNDTDETYTENDRTEIREQIKSMQEEWKDLDDETLANNCSAELEKYKADDVKEELSKIGCSL